MANPGETADPHVTVAICTWNRAQSLARTLDSLVAMKKPPGLHWEVVIVDNNSTDTTAQCIQSYVTQLPVVSVFEKQAGVVYARNAAIRNSRGKYILWTDDDVVVQEDWLIAYLDAFERHPQVALFGGPIYADFEGQVPTWLEKGWEAVKIAYCHNDMSDEEIPLVEHPPGFLPYGANFAIRSIEQKKELFDLRLGYMPSRPYIAEETGMMKKVLSSGAKGMWIPAARVRHINGQDRLTLKYVRGYYERQGRTWKASGPSLPGRRFFGSPLWLWRQVIESGAQYFYARIFNEPSVWLTKLATYSVKRGYLKEVRLERFGGPIKISQV